MGPSIGRNITGKLERRFRRADSKTSRQGNPTDGTSWPSHRAPDHSGYNFRRQCVPKVGDRRRGPESRPDLGLAGFVGGRRRCRRPFEAGSGEIEGGGTARFPSRYPAESTPRREYQMHRIRKSDASQSQPHDWIGHYIQTGAGEGGRDRVTFVRQANRHVRTFVPIAGSHRAMIVKAPTNSLSLWEGQVMFFSRGYLVSASSRK